MGIPPITFYMLTIKFIIYFSKNKIVVLEKTLESFLDFKEIKPVTSKENQYSQEELMLNLMLQIFDHLIQRANLLEKTLML